MPRTLWIAVASAVLSASLLAAPAFGFFGLFCHKKRAPAPAPQPVCTVPVNSCYGGSPSPYASCYGGAYQGNSCYGSAYSGYSCYGSQTQSYTGCYGSQPSMQYYAPAPVYRGCYGH